MAQQQSSTGAHSPTNTLFRRRRRAQTLARWLPILTPLAAHRQDLESRALKGDLTKAMMGTILAYITFGGSMFGAVYLLMHDKPIQSLVALIVALGSAFGPKVYADFIQPNASKNDQQPPALPS